MPGFMHESAIDLICAKEGMQKKGFPKQFKTIFVDDSKEAMEDFVAEELADGNDRSQAELEFKELCAQEKKTYSPGFLPDAFKFDHETKTVICVEVENTSRVDDRKFQLYTNAWFWLDCELWSIELHIYDRFGTLSAKLNDDDLCSRWLMLTQKRA